MGRYIAIKYANQGTQLYPEDLQKKALVEQAASVETANWDPHAAGIAFETVFKKYASISHLFATSD
jgi:glutathione S-transferase